VVIAVATETSDIERLNDLAILSAELTASCSSLASEWLGNDNKLLLMDYGFNKLINFIIICLGVLMALCCSSNNPIIFGEVLSRVDMNDITVHNSLALFTSILVGKH